MNNNYYIGLDVHKDSIAIAYAFGGDRGNAIYHGSCKGSLINIEDALRKFAKKFKVAFRDLKLCYEAGPTGFVLARHFIGLGLEVIIMAPTKSKRKPGERIKTDKRDAIKIAKEFRNGDVVGVRVPPPRDEAVRDVARARTDATDDLIRSKQRLKAFLLRNGYRYTGNANWGEAHMRYLRKLKVQDPSQKVVLEEYLVAINIGIERVSRLTEKMKEILTDWEWEPTVRALMAFKGFQEVAAMTIIGELGDLRRFSHPKKLMAFLGLVPDEDTSGTKRRQGSITKCGNSHARWMLVECSQHYRRPANVSPALTKRQEGQNAKVKNLSWRTQNRLHLRYKRLKARQLNENKAIIAVARELCAFIWELQNKCDLPLPEQSPNT